MEFKILFGSLEMDNFPQMEDKIRDLKSMTLERYRQKLKFKHIDLMHIDVTLMIRPRPILIINQWVPLPRGNDPNGK